MPCFLLLQLIFATQNLLWVILFLVYGIDAVVTILYRLKRGENIFKPHRTHLYQYLCNELRWQHRTVALVYGVVQLGVNVILIFAIHRDMPWIAIGTGAILLGYYLIQRQRIVKSITKRS